MQELKMKKIYTTEKDTFSNNRYDFDTFSLRVSLKNNIIRYFLK